MESGCMHDEQSYFFGDDCFVFYCREERGAASFLLCFVSAHFGMCFVFSHANKKGVIVTLIWMQELEIGSWLGPCT